MNKNLSHKIEKISIQANMAMLSALKKMDEIDKKLLFVFDKQKFKSILSIGDIQRAIIKNVPLETPVSEILRQEITVSYLHESKEAVTAKMLQLRTECMPVLDENNNLVDVYFWENIFPETQKNKKHQLNLPVVIMAGGKGTRLKPITNVIPKPLVPINDKTIIENIMDKFVEVGCNNFVVSVNYKAEMMKYYLSSLSENDYKISYIKEEKPLGTAGSLHLLKGKINTTFFISNCDIIIDQDYSEIYNYHKDNKNELTIVAALKHYKIPYGTIKTKENGILTELIEKPELTFKINSGMYVLEPHLINEVPDNTFFHITELIDNIIKRNGKVGVFPVSEKSWKDIGTWDEYFNLI